MGLELFCQNTALITPWSQVRVLAGPPPPREIIILWHRERGIRVPWCIHWGAGQIGAPGEESGGHFLRIHWPFTVMKFFTGAFPLHEGELLSEGRGHRFESCRARHYNQTVMKPFVWWIFFVCAAQVQRAWAD